MAEDGWGSIDVTSLRLADGADLTKAMRFEHPDDDNAKDRTVVRVPLPEPVPPGGEVSFDVAWKARLPRVFARTGYVRDYFLVGQWFPKLGVYEPAGMRGRAAGGWNCHQFHANSEFYADFGKYRVSITLPARFVVGATGPRVEKRDEPRRHGDARVRAGRRDRLRLDGLARLRRGRGHVRRGEGRDARGVRRDGEAPWPQRRRVAPPERGRARPAAAGPPAASRAPRRRDEGRDQVVRPVVRAVPVPDDHRRRPGTRRRGIGGDGVPDVHHRGHLVPRQPLAVRARAPSRRR